MVPIAQASGQYLTLSQYSGNPGSTIQVQGHSFQPNESVVIFINSIREPGTAGATTDGSGNFSVTYTIPMLGAGSIPIHAFGGTESAQAGYYVNGYYPTAQPSSYYLLPGQWLSFSGQNFWPNEPVALWVNGNMIGSFTAAGGSVNTGNVYTVPYSAANSTLSTMLVGAWSGMSVSMNIGVGTFYPQISPSSYYVPANQSFNVGGSSFAPNEPVTLWVGGQSWNLTADGNGNFNTNVSTSAVGNVNIQAKGMWSNTSSQRTITTY